VRAADRLPVLLHPGQQPVRDRPAAAVPDHGPHRLPAGVVGAGGLPGVPRGRDPPARPGWLPEEGDLPAQRADAGLRAAGPDRDLHQVRHEPDHAGDPGLRGDVLRPPAAGGVHGGRLLVAAGRLGDIQAGVADLLGVRHRLDVPGGVDRGGPGLHLRHADRELHRNGFGVRTLGNTKRTIRSPPADRSKGIQVSNTLIVAQEILAQEEPINPNQGLAMIGYGLAAVGPGVGVGLIWAAVINGSARQPELQGRLMTIAWTTFALVEVLALIGLVLFFIAGGAG